MFVVPYVSVGVLNVVYVSVGEGAGNNSGWMHNSQGRAHQCTLLTNLSQPNLDCFFDLAVIQASLFRDAYILGISQPTTML
ncbi:MAG: hypothetical protein AAF703_24125 [Cyanobacteria bacterium P01_D01_bin.105]